MKRTAAKVNKQKQIVVIRLISRLSGKHVKCNIDVDPPIDPYKPPQNGAVQVLCRFMQSAGSKANFRKVE